MSKINLYRGLYSAAAGLILATAGGCTPRPLTENDQIIFTGVEDASVTDYINVINFGEDKDDIKSYFVRKSELLLNIPEYDEAYTLGLGVNEEGNAYVIQTEDITEDDTTISCIKEYDENTHDSKIYIEGVDFAHKVQGYRVKVDGVYYDVSKDQVVDVLNDSKKSIISNGGSIGTGIKLEFESNEKGGQDKVYSKR